MKKLVDNLTKIQLPEDWRLVEEHMLDLSKQELLRRMSNKEFTKFTTIEGGKIEINTARIIHASLLQTGSTMFAKDCKDVILEKVLLPCWSWTDGRMDSCNGVRRS